MCDRVKLSIFFLNMEFAYVSYTHLRRQTSINLDTGQTLWSILTVSVGLEISTLDYPASECILMHLNIFYRFFMNQGGQKFWPKTGQDYRNRKKYDTTLHKSRV